MALSWARTIQFVQDYQTGAVLLGRLMNGQTYVRVHFRWGFYGDTSTIVAMDSIAANLQTFGIITVFGDGTETPPTPFSSPNDPDPPTQRWLWYETRSPVPRVMSDAANVIAWTDSGSTEPTDIKAQVLATGVPAGDQLDLWATWSAVAPWDASGSAIVWVQTSVLYKH